MIKSIPERVEAAMNRSYTEFDTAMRVHHAKLDGAGREAMIEEIMWINRDNERLVLKPGHRDWPSTVAVDLNTRLVATEEELRWLLAYSRASTDSYDKIWSQRRGMNLAMIWIMDVPAYTSLDGRTYPAKRSFWFRRQSWEYPPARFDNLADFIAGLPRFR